MLDIHKYVKTYYLNIYMYLIHRLHTGTNNQLQSMMREKEIVLNSVHQTKTRYENFSYLINMQMTTDVIVMLM